MPKESIVQQHLSLTELYTRVLRLRREYEIEESKGTAICRACGHPESNHLSDGRCSAYATSRDFRNDRLEENTAIERAIVLIEELTDL